MPTNITPSLKSSAASIKRMLGGTVTCLSPSSPPTDNRAVVGQTEDQNLIRLAVQGRIGEGDGRPVVDPARVSNALLCDVRIGHPIDIFRLGVAEHPPAHDMDILEQPAGRTPGQSPAN